ncbi:MULTISPECIES: Rap1a/Tai family immunity protein [unclassified Arsukibacterium]|uniref:Rap1a/Tai family immunity protein n=1 Tax=unclassified Arsukibacterium TaxID=2635278 RepID=UPI0025BD7286|nr:MULTISPECIES: Rap1a/Tai family immunity protein [unclassified Arsukibacterium]|tara:strand:+ start:708 stop:1103 length:396 start_codon:yes stop_codon:yes gene_type:complete
MQIRSIVLSMSLFSALVSCTALGTGQDNARVPLDRLQALSNGQPVTPLPPAFSAQATKGIANDQLAMYLAGVIDSGEGRSWCVATSGLPPHEVNQQLLAELQRDLQQQKVTANANSAVLLASKLEVLFPCK